MKKSAVALLLPVAASALLATTLAGQDVPAKSLDAMRHQYRALLIFAGPHDDRVEQQWSTLVANRAAAADRQLVTVLLTPSQTTMHDGDRPPQASFHQAEQDAIRKRFHIDPATFTVLLVGKDGGEKLRSDQPIPWETLSQTIDSMPMRRLEMRQTGR